MAQVNTIELYKKYRPQTFGQLVGQEKLGRSLKAAVAQNEVPTAYAFTGPRGCGKTSAALVLAKAINCENPQAGDPCNSCDVCLNIDAGSQIGINYISMANKGSVDDVREIVQTARYSTSINRQVFILDEVHNLSKPAFDALLIPLEDPKMPALFILCSTEVNKIPVTILSRVQSRRLNLVPADLMKTHLKDLLQREALEVEDESLDSAIRSGRGSVRDTLSALQGIISTGELSANHSGRILEAFVSGDLAKVLDAIAGASADSATGRELAEQLFEDLRDLYLVASGVQSDKVQLPLADPEAAARRLLGAKGLSLTLGEVGDALTRMSLGADARVHFEVAVVKALQKLRQLKARAIAARDKSGD